MFTFAGRVLALATLLVVGGMFYWFVMFVNDNLPSGRYPVAFLLMPGVIVALVFFVVLSFVLELVGIRIWKKQDVHDKTA
jgi:hypothetical protein